MKKLVLASAALVSAAALSQAPSTEPRSEPDSGRMICVSQSEIGSRLNRRRVCRTKAEWDAHKALSRDTVDRVQQFKPVICDPAGTSGRPC